MEVKGVLGLSRQSWWPKSAARFEQRDSYHAELHKGEQYFV